MTMILRLVNGRAAALGALAGVALLAGCAAGGGAASVPQRSFQEVPMSPEQSAGTDDRSMAPIGGVPPAVLEAIIEDAAQRGGVEPAEVEVIKAEEVTWNDGSLGCPEPGMMYTQALVPGFRVVVEAGGERMNFHVGSGESFIFCENPRPGAGGTGS